MRSEVNIFDLVLLILLIFGNDKDFRFDRLQIFANLKLYVATFVVLKLL